jgi:hypothetical protein
VFSSKQVVTMVVAVCAAVGLAPVAVFAATGQLVNITDPAYSTRQARVSTGGGLVVESRAWAGANAFNANVSRQGLGWVSLAQATGPTRIALTELALTGSFDPHPGYAEVLVEAMVRTSGTSACNGPGSAGYTRHTLKRVSVSSRATLQLTFDGQPLVIPAAASGQPVCVGITVITVSSGLWVYGSATGYKYV